MKIGVLSARTGIASSAIRFYEKRGLLPPATRSSNGYRSYDEADVKRLQIITLSQSFGLSIDALRTVFADNGNFSKGEMLSRLDTRLNEIGSLVRALSAQQNELRRVRETLAESWDAGICADPKALQDGHAAASPAPRDPAP